MLFVNVILANGGTDEEIENIIRVRKVQVVRDDDNEERITIQFRNINHVRIPWDKHSVTLSCLSRLGHIEYHLLLYISLERMWRLGIPRSWPTDENNEGHM